MRFMTILAALCSFALVRLKADLQYPIAQCVTIQRLNSYNGFVIVCHGNEAETFTFVCLQVAYNFDALNGAKWSKELPQHVFFSFWCQIVYEYAPS